MIGPTTKQMIPNINCTRCGYRHPQQWSCRMAAVIAEAQRFDAQERIKLTGKIICRCGKGYGSALDGLCFTCRGKTGYEAIQAKGKK